MQVYNILVGALGPLAPAPPPGGPPLMSSTSVVAAARPVASTPRGPIINVFNIGGAHCQTCRQHPQGARYQRLQHRWWSLLKIQTAPPGGPPLMSPTSVVATVRNPNSTPMGPTIDVFHFGGDRCQKSRQHPLGGPLSMPSTLVVVAAENPDNTPTGPTIDVFNFGGGRCWTCHQYPPGCPPSTSSTLVVAAVGPITSIP
jgi:hypothetical protein